jgi:hypothetical protein
VTLDAGTDPVADDVATWIAAGTARRIPTEALMPRLVALRPELATSADRYHRLRAVVDELARRGVIEPSKAHQTRLGVRLPRSLLVAGRAPAAAVENPARRFPWVTEMAWAANGPRRPAVVHDQLVSISTWIAVHRRPPTVPVRERSLEVLGDDKALDRLLAGVLRGRAAAVAALAIEQIHPPMAFAEVAGAVGRRVLVVENGTTFHSALRAARHHVAAGVPVAVRWVGYGAGGQMEAIVPSLCQLDPDELAYFGDLDPEGLGFAARGAVRAREAGLPPLAPARVLYQWLLDRGRPQRKARPAPWPADGLAWLGTDLAACLDRTLGDAGWLAQEWVGITALETDPTWCSANRPVGRTGGT